jgi:hypothetical protein
MRMTRDSIPSSIWPDTLHVFLFYDPLDEEIALERGELDVAIFWPGELSRRIREDVRWRGFPVGRRSHGVLAISGNSGVKASGDVEFRSGPLARLAPDSSAAESFNQEFFRGDLSLLHPGTGQWTLFPRGIGADARMPGHDVLRKRLQLGPDDMANRGPSHRLLYVEASPDTAATSTFIPLFRVACPVVCVPSLRPLVNALGADAFADMSQCSQERAEESRR